MSAFQPTDSYPKAHASQGLDLGEDAGRDEQMGQLVRRTTANATSSSTLSSPSPSAMIRLQAVSALSLATNARRTSSRRSTSGSVLVANAFRRSTRPSV